VGRESAAHPAAWTAPVFGEQVQFTDSRSGAFGEGLLDAFGQASVIRPGLLDGVSAFLAHPSSPAFKTIAEKL